MLAATATLLCAAHRAYGGPPMITDDPGTPRAGVWEENIALTLTWTRHQAVWQTPVFDNNYNLTGNVQLNYTLPFLIVDNDGDHGPVSGIGASSIGFKYRFLDQAKDGEKHGGPGFSMSTAPAFNFNNPTHSVRRHLIADGSSVFLPIEFDKTIGKVDVFGEVGYLAVQFSPDQWSYGIGLDWHVSNKWDLLAELHYVSDTSFRVNDPVINFGTVVALSGKTNLLFSIGRSLRDDGNSFERLVLYAGLQFHF
jgi:hypothetical protein